MKNKKIRYSKLPKYSMGTKLPKYDNGTLYGAGGNGFGYEDNTTSLDDSIDNFNSEKKKNNQRKGLQMGAVAASSYANYASIQEDPNETDPYEINKKSREKQEAKAGIVTNTIGTAIPVAGAVIGIGDAIGKPIRTKNERLNDDGTLVNKNAARAGAIVGSFASPSKALALRGSYKGGYTDITGKGYINHLEEAGRNEIERKRLEEQRLEKERIDTENKNRDIYSRAYVDNNPTYGVQGSSIYKYGSALPKYPFGTGDTDKKTTPVKSMSSKDWDAQNASLGYKLANERSKENNNPLHYNDYYDPKKYLPSDTGFIKLGDQGKTVDYNNDPTYNPLISYTPQTVVKQRKPTVIPTSNRVTVGFNTFNGKATTLYKYNDGRTETVFNDGSGTVPQMAYGGKIDKMAVGGDMNQLASNIHKAEGDTHEEDTNNDGQGGITLHDSNGQPKAEIEDQEVVVDNSKVLSNRLPFSRNMSFADVGENLGKDKALNEKKLQSNSMFTRNTGKRNIQKIDEKMNTLLKYQDVVRKNLGLDAEQPMQMAYGGNMQDIGEGVENLAPYLDNIINYSLIKKTPKVPKPEDREFLDEMAIPLKTDFNINPQLASNNQDLREFNRTILDNTSSSNTARANMSAGFAQKIKANNELYGQKENVETQLKNSNAQNSQSVLNKNIQNRQSIKLLNSDLKDKYNWNNMIRDEDIRQQKSQLAAETTDDLTTSIKDKRMAKLDNQRIAYDALKYEDAAGLSSLIGTEYMKDMVSTKEGKQKTRKALKNRPKDLEKFNRIYGLD